MAPIRPVTLCEDVASHPVILIERGMASVRPVNPRGGVEASVSFTEEIMTPVLRSQWRRCVFCVVSHLNSSERH